MPMSNDIPHSSRHQEAADGSHATDASLASVCDRTQKPPGKRIPWLLHHLDHVVAMAPCYPRDAPPLAPDRLAAYLPGVDLHVAPWFPGHEVRIDLRLSKLRPGDHIDSRTFEITTQGGSLYLRYLNWCVSCSEENHDAFLAEIDDQIENFYCCEPFLYDWPFSEWLTEKAARVRKRRSASG